MLLNFLIIVAWEKQNNNRIKISYTDLVVDLLLNILWQKINLFVTSIPNIFYFHNNEA